MRTKAITKRSRISPQKTRLVANMIRGRKVNDAFDILAITNKKAAQIIRKTLNSAVSNAENKSQISRENLLIAEILIDGGPTVKRWRPRAMGRAGKILKRTSHITITVEEINKEKKKKIKKTAVKKNIKEKKEHKDGS